MSRAYVILDLDVDEERVNIESIVTFLQSVEGIVSVSVESVRR